MVGPEKDPGRRVVTEIQSEPMEGISMEGIISIYQRLKTNDMGILKGPIQGLILVSTIEGEKP